MHKVTVASKVSSLERDVLDAFRRISTLSKKISPILEMRLEYIDARIKQAEAIGAMLSKEFRFVVDQSEKRTLERIAGERAAIDGLTAAIASLRPPTRGRGVMRKLPGQGKPKRGRKRG